MARIDSADIPELTPNEGSWIVYRKDTGKIVGEFFKADRHIVERFRNDRVRVVTITQHLSSLNAR